MRIYFAAPLFTTPQRSWNSLLANNLRSHGHEVDLPQEFCGGGGIPGPISDLCLTYIDLCDIILVNCDGPDADSGTCMEFGYARDKKSIAYRTDMRQVGDCDKNVNLMIAEQVDVFLNLPLANYSEVGRAILGVIDRWKSEED